MKINLLNWLPPAITAGASFVLAFVDVLIKERRHGFSPVDSWSIMSPGGKFCAILCGACIVIVFIQAIVKALMQIFKPKNRHANGHNRR